MMAPRPVHLAVALLVALGATTPLAGQEEEEVRLGGLGASPPPGYARNAELEDDVRRYALEKGDVEGYRLIVLGRIEVGAELSLERFRELMEERFPEEWSRVEGPSPVQLAGLPAEGSRFTFDAGGVTWHHDFVYFIVSGSHAYAELVAPEAVHGEAREEFETFLDSIRVAPDLRPAGRGTRIEHVLEDPASFAGDRIILTGRLAGRSLDARPPTLDLTDPEGRELGVDLPARAPLLALARELEENDHVWVEGAVREEEGAAPRLDANRLGPATHEPATVADLVGQPSIWSGHPILVEGRLHRDDATRLRGPDGAEILLRPPDDWEGEGREEEPRVLVLGRLTEVAGETVLQADVLHR